MSDSSVPPNPAEPPRGAVPPHLASTPPTGSAPLGVSGPVGATPGTPVGTPAMASAAAAPEVPARVRGSRTRAREQREHRARERVRVVVRGIGEILITLGLVLLLFCAYQIYWTDFTSDRASAAELNQLEEQFAAVAPPKTNGKIPPLGPLEEGEPFARMYVPTFGDNWVRPIIEGTSQEDLHKGVGHYVKSALPGQTGNFAVAGHRTTNGHPFRKIDDLEIGDKLYVETKDAWYVYSVIETRLIVDPDDVYVVAPVPEEDKAGAKPTRKLMTLTSCHPPYSAAQRMIAHAELTEVRARGAGPPAGAPV